MLSSLGSKGPGWVVVMGLNLYGKELEHRSLTFVTRERFPYFDLGMVECRSLTSLSAWALSSFSFLQGIRTGQDLWSLLCVNLGLLLVCAWHLDALVALKVAEYFIVSFGRRRAQRLRLGSFGGSGTRALPLNAERQPFQRVFPSSCVMCRHHHCTWEVSLHRLIQRLRCEM